MSNSHRSRTKRFSLIELLIVVAIIIILISIIQPALRKAIIQAEYVLCTNKMKQLHTGQILYTEDQKVFPNYTQWVIGQWHQTGAVENGVLFDYIQTKDTYKCPTFRDLLDDMPNTNGEKTMGDVKFTMREEWRTFEFSYLMSEGAQGRTPQSISDPSSMSIHAEENPFKIIGFTNHQINDGRILVVRPPAIVDTLASFHTSGGYGNSFLPTMGNSNILYVDGHVGLGNFLESYDLLFDGEWKGQ